MQQTDESSSLDPISIMSACDLHTRARTHSKSIVLEQSPDNSASPWRIRVTVEPESKADMRQHRRTPIINRQLRTSTRVPLKAPGPGTPDMPSHDTTTDKEELDRCARPQRRNSPHPRQVVTSAGQGLQPGDSTILESEEFSMVSVASLDSHRTASSQLHKTIARSLHDLQNDCSIAKDSPSLPRQAARYGGRTNTTPENQSQPSTMLPVATKQHDVASHRNTSITPARRNSVVHTGRVLQDIVRTPDQFKTSADQHHTSFAESDSLEASYSHLPTPDTSENSAQLGRAADLSRISATHNVSQSHGIDPMSWVATGTPRLDSPIMRSSHSLQDERNRISVAVPQAIDENSDARQTKANRSIENGVVLEGAHAHADAEHSCGSRSRIDSVEPDVALLQTQKSDKMRSMVDETGIFWKDRKGRHVGLNTDDSVLSELRPPSSPFTDCDESSLLQGTIFEKTPARIEQSNHSDESMSQSVRSSLADTSFTNGSQSTTETATDASSVDSSRNVSRSMASLSTIAESQIVIRANTTASLSDTSQSGDCSVRSDPDEVTSYSVTRSLTSTGGDSLDSVGQQLMREAMQHQAQTMIEKDLPCTSQSNAEVCDQTTHDVTSNAASVKAEQRVSHANRRPQRVPVDFGDYTGVSSLPDPECAYPDLYDKTIPHLTPRRDETTPTESNLSYTAASTTSLASRAWSALTSLSTIVGTTDINTSEATSRLQAVPTSPPRVIIEDTTLRLRRKYGLHSDKQPFTYAHIRTLHRMLNSVRHHVDATIIPTSGTLSPSLSLALRERAADKNRNALKRVHCYAVQAFMLLLLPESEIEYFHRNGEWGDDVTIKSRGRDSKSRHGSRAVFGFDPDPMAHTCGGKIREQWVLDIVLEIIEKEKSDLQAGKKGGGTVKVIQA